MVEQKKDNRRFKVIFASINVGDYLYRRDEVLTAEQIGEVDLHLSRGAIVQVFESSKEKTSPRVQASPNSKKIAEG
jgi:hypothetical protein